jgi:hypothetical protein
MQPWSAPRRMQSATLTRQLLSTDGWRDVSRRTMLFLGHQQEPEPCRPLLGTPSAQEARPMQVNSSNEESLMLVVPSDQVLVKVWTRSPFASFWRRLRASTPRVV